MSGGALALRPLPLPFDASFDLPGSKSTANRALVCAALARGTTLIEHATPCDDVVHLVEGLRRLGFRLQWQDRDAGRMEVSGGIPEGGESAELHCGNAGTALRFLVSVAALVPGRWTVTGDRHMQARPVADLVAAWRRLGLRIESSATGCPPVVLTGGHRQGGAVTLDAARSSQYLSSMMMVGSSLAGGLDIELRGELASSGYVELTTEVMRGFGMPVRQEDGRFRVAEAEPRARPRQVVEGDWSAAGAFLVLAEIARGRFEAGNLATGSRQSDRHVVGQIEALRGDGERTIDVTQTPDQLMNLAILAAHRQGRTRFVGAANLRIKECDRLAVTVRELRRAGATAAEHEDGITVEGRARLRPCRFDPEGDHRLAMAFALLGQVHDGFSVSDPGCVSKSYPRFFEDLRSLSSSARPIAVVGMRAAGKTTFGRALAEALGLGFRDSDEAFVARHGSIADFVHREGWPAFREREEELCPSLLESGIVLALGGGAIESARTRDELARRALVVWLDEDLELVRERLDREPGGRPSLSGAGLGAELEELDRRRRPIFEKLHDVLVEPGLTPDAQVEAARRALRDLCSW